ncbi:glycosyltransferase family 4 protein [Oceanidesulfovibrio marinus]|uniref:Glycosyltransferase family 4 protein n=1 Tax=Oceanidesulfovibrio marinus TaxID=370038 RepID=A0ABX6NC10_9BACT|nr:glycosyltransferase family 4 protein [Oceanidesulfovibrio marinus]QJT08133.1 glycosyltransferase family 4 protein [Oceanidesulfovibrio marinus]
MTQHADWGTLDPFYEGLAGKVVMGRPVANAGFLDALLRRDPFPRYHFYLESERLAAMQSQELERRHPTLHARGAFVVDTWAALPHALATNRFHAFHLSDCHNRPGPMVRLRNLHAPDIFPITATTHSLSFQEFKRHVLAHLWQGVTPRDCTVCTSRAAEKVMQGYYGWLREAYGLGNALFREPTLEIVPLGVEPKAYLAPDPAEKRWLREMLAAHESDEKVQGGLAIPKDAVMLLALGRVSPGLKMDLLPVVRAVQRLVVKGRDPSSLCLVVAGSMPAKDPYLDLLQALARNIGLTVRRVPRPDEGLKRTLLAAADIFISPSDNVQETFGLTILEAGASGLPVIASDWDGYRDLVASEGENATGILVRTFGRQEQSPMDDAMGSILPGDVHHLRLAQSTAVDVAALARAIETLASDEPLRQAMGRRAHERVTGQFSWDHVVERHLALWDELWTRTVDEDAARKATPPFELPYGRIFGWHPSAKLNGLIVQTSRSGENVYRGREFPQVYADLDGWLPEQALKPLLVLARKPRPAAELVQRLAAAQSLTPEEAERLALWALKHDLLEIVE